MTFYGEWQQNRERCIPDGVFIQRFIDCTDRSAEPLINGEEADVVEAIKVLLSVPIVEFVNEINHAYEFTSKDVFQYSNLDDATTALCTILGYEEYTLTYEEAGARLTHTPQQYARIKYGENHAKVAAAFSLVCIMRDKEKKCNIMRISSLGKVLPFLNDHDKNEVIKRVAIRNPFIKTMIYYAKQGVFDYEECVSSALSGQTIIRRRNNNKKLIDLILGDNPIRNNIRWY